MDRADGVHPQDHAARVRLATAIGWQTAAIVERLEYGEQLRVSTRFTQVKPAVAFEVWTPRGSVERSMLAEVLIGDVGGIREERAEAMLRELRQKSK